MDYNYRVLFLSITNLDILTGCKTNLLSLIASEYKTNYYLLNVLNTLFCMSERLTALTFPWHFIWKDLILLLHLTTLNCSLLVIGSNCTKYELCMFRTKTYPLLFILSLNESIVTNFECLLYVTVLANFSSSLQNLRWVL
jgi:hypothetical protein